MNNIDEKKVISAKYIINLVNNDDKLCEIKTRNLIFGVSNFDYLYEIDKDSFYSHLGIFSILVNFELYDGIYEIIKYTLLVDLKFLNLPPVYFNIIVVDNVDNLTGIFKVNNSTYFNINMNNQLLESVKIEDFNKLNNYIDNHIKVKDSICFCFDYKDLDVYRCYSNISNLSHIHTEIDFDIIIDLDLDLLNIILVLKRLYEALIGLTKSNYYCKLSLIIHDDIMFNIKSETLNIYLKKLLNYFDIINIEYLINSEKKVYTFN